MRGEIELVRLGEDTDLVGGLAGTDEALGPEGPHLFQLDALAPLGLLQPEEIRVAPRQHPAAGRADAAGGHRPFLAEEGHGKIPGGGVLAHPPGSIQKNGLTQLPGEERGQGFLEPGAAQQVRQTHQNFSNRSTSRTKMVAPPTRTSTGMVGKKATPASDTAGMSCIRLWAC